MAAAKTSLPGGYDHEAGRSTKTVTFYVNGDRNFQGHVMVITPRRFRNVEGLLDELHRLTYSRHVKDLPLGVRYLFSLESGDRIDNLDQLIDGKAYVCSSHSRLKKISYGGKPLFANWGSRQRIELPSLHLMAYNEPKRRSLGVKTTEHSRQRGYSDPKSILGDGRAKDVKPKIVTVVRNGPHKPRTAVKTLLNKRTAKKLEQVLDEVSNSFGNTSGLSAPRKLYNVSGQLISDVMELFRDENNIFIAVGSEKFSPDNIADILEDLEHSSSSNKRSKYKESKASNEGMLHNKQKKNKEHDQVKTINTDEESKLPKLPDIHANFENKPKQESNNKPHWAANSNAKKSHVNHKAAKHVPSRSLGKKQNHNAVKLPQIGSSNLVSQPEKETKENKVISKPSNKENGDVARVQNANNELNEMENVNNNFLSADKPSRKESVGNKHSVGSKVNTKKTSRDDSGIISDAEVKYGTVTDKTVEDVYLMGKKIGDGNFADVRECTDKITKKEFALKIVDKSKIQGKEQMIRDEIDIMRRCKHPNIVRMYEDYDTPRHIYLVMELIKGGDLFDAISSSVKFTEAVTRNYVKDIAKSLNYLHKRKIVHRDLKPENLLVSQLVWNIVTKIQDYDDQLIKYPRDSSPEEAFFPWYSALQILGKRGLCWQGTPGKTLPIPSR